MWCPKFHSEVICNYCVGINNCFASAINPQTTYYEQKILNYECPDCHGKFNYAQYKWINTETKEIGSNKIVANTNQGYYGYACPFCNKIMTGLV